MVKTKESKKLSRKEKEHLFRRREILDAAMKLFSAKGYIGTSMQEIAQASEFSIGTLYNFFSTKEVLYLTMVEGKFMESREFIESRVAKKDKCLDKISAAVEALLTFMENNREFFNLFLALRGVPEAGVSGVHEKLQQYFEKHVNFFLMLMEEGVKKKLFKGYAPDELALSLIGMTNAWIYKWLKGPEDKSLRDQHEAIMEMFLYGAGKQKPKP